MKKRTLFYSILIFLSLSATVQGFSREKKKIALVSFYGDRRILTPGLDGSLMEKLLGDSTFNITQMVKKSYNALLTSLKDDPIHLVSTDSVASNSTYNSQPFKLDNVDNKWLNMTYISANDSLRVLFPKEVYSENDLSPVILGKAFKDTQIADGTMYASLVFSTQPTLTGFKIRACISIYLFDSEGKQLFIGFPSDISDDQIDSKPGYLANVIALVEQRETALKLCEQATNKLINGDSIKKFPLVLGGALDRRQ